jgi:hypothetical protein
MRELVLVGCFVALAFASVGCESILGIDDHAFAPRTEDGGGKLADSGIAEDQGDSGKKDVDTPGHAVASLQCAADTNACVSGGIFSVGQASPDHGGVASLPDGAAITLTDEGFEFGGTMCDDAGTTCVTGALTP